MTEIRTFTLIVSVLKSTLPICRKRGIIFVYFLHGGQRWIVHVYLVCKLQLVIQYNKNRRRQYVKQYPIGQ